ncbi:MAG: carbon-nitrogen hydrolase family protein [Pseudomonadota bacterium]
MTTRPEEDTLRVALVQMCSGREPARNLADATAQIRRAAAGGARYVQTPEVTTLMELDRERLLALCRTEAEEPAIPHLAALAAELGIWLHVGSLALRADGDKLANRSILFSPSGRIAARYDKIHMFDVELPGGESYRESRNYEPGRHAVVAETPWGGLGMTICYDLRFPYLHRALAKAGAIMLAVPAAFTRTTGEAHWHTLIRARAIEAQCFVLAATQGGMHEHGRETYGHSLVVSPWGEVLAEGGVHPDVIFADLHLADVGKMRRRVPSLEHDRSFDVVTMATAAAEDST